MAESFNKGGAAIYSAKVINANLEEFAARHGWMPTYHSLEWANEFKAYIESVITMESNSKTSYVSLAQNLTEKRKKEIRQAVINEQVLCGLDSGYWERNYAFVCNEQGQIYKFKNRMSQTVFDSVIAEFDEKQVSIEILCLKARQLGVTTKTVLKFLHRMLFVPHTHRLSVMASVQAEKSGTHQQDTRHRIQPITVVASTSSSPEACFCERIDSINSIRHAGDGYQRKAGPQPAFTFPS